MTTPALQADLPDTASPSREGVPARRERLTTILGAHTVTDFFSFLFIPILSVLEGRLDMSPREGAIILSTGAVCSGLVQPFVAWLGDRFDTRMLSPLALATAVISISLVGQATNFWHLFIIQVIGTAGIGAFHPAAAAAVGQLSGRKRSLGVSLFFFTGMAGGVLGNNLSPFMQRQFGLPNYIWLVIPGLVTALALAWAIRRVPHRHHTAAAQHLSWSEEESKARWFAIGVLYLGNVLRFTVNMMLVQLVIRWTEQAVLVRGGGRTHTRTPRERCPAQRTDAGAQCRSAWPAAACWPGRSCARTTKRRPSSRCPSSAHWRSWPSPTPPVPLTASGSCPCSCPRPSCWRSRRAWATPVSCRSRSPSPSGCSPTAPRWPRA
ncbi:MAG: MFS transporter [Planctomycetota bacterium]|nr:MAG: MFS transporter [Planctomycetota bacterium]